MQQISFAVDGLKLVGSIFYPKNPKKKNPAILFVPGWTSEKERSYQYAEALSNLGYVCMIFDMRGHGKSEGDIRLFTTRDFLTDALTAYDYLSHIDSVDENDISAVGSSFGCYLISLLSEKREIRNMALRSPADYPNTYFDQSKYITSGVESPEMLAWRKQSKKPDETLALKGINNFNREILIIESENDNIVPRETVENYINAIKNKRKLTHAILKKAPHTIVEGEFRDEVTRVLTKWFKSKI